MKKNLLAVFVLSFATLLLAGCMTTNNDVTTDDTVAEQDVVVGVEVVEPTGDAQEAPTEEENVQESTGTVEDADDATTEDEVVVEEKDVQDVAE